MLPYCITVSVKDSNLFMFDPVVSLQTCVFCFKDPGYIFSFWMFARVFFFLVYVITMESCISV